MKIKFLLIAILLISAFLRLYQLGNTPPSPDWDEVALGYNAYSIWKTGMDEYGTTFPIVLRSFDDYKPPLYMYLTIPFVALFGLEVWAVRLPSALFGISAILGTYLLVKQLFDKEFQNSNNKCQINNKYPIHNKQKNYIFRYLKLNIVWSFVIGHWSFPNNVALLSAILLGISPWHINFSRIAFEANVGVALNIWGIYFFLSARKHSFRYIISTIIFGLALYAYHSERVFVPLIVVFLLISQWKDIVHHTLISVISFIVACLFIIPLIYILLNPANLTRFSGTSVFADQTEVLKKSVQKLEDDAKNGNPWGIIFDNRRIVYGMKIAEGYLMHFSPKWLFLTSDQERHHAPGMGNLYIFEAPLIILGLLWLLRQKIWARNFLLFWFLISPIPASPTSGVPHSIRSLVFLPTFQIFSAIGIVTLIKHIQIMGPVARKPHHHLQREAPRLASPIIYYVIVCIIFIIPLIFIIHYLDLYFNHLNSEFSFAWQYGYKQAVEYAESYKTKYKKIVVSTALEQPHMFFLFYTKYDPKKYLDEGGTRSGGFEEYRNKFGKYEFKSINWDREPHDGSVLYIGKPMEIKSNPIEKIQFLDGKDAMYIAQ